MKIFLYKYYLIAKRKAFRRSQSNIGTFISKEAHGYQNVCFEGQNAVPEGCSFAGNITLGYKTTLGKNNLIGGEVRIGKYCQLGMNVAIHGTNHPITYMSTYINSRLFEGLSNLKNEKSIVIGNDVWVGHAAIILSGVSIGNGAIIAAGSVVTKDVDPYSIVAGNPARFMRRRFPQTVINEIQELQWWNMSEPELEKIKHLFFKDFSKVNSIYD